MKEIIDPKTGKEVLRDFKGIWISKEFWLCGELSCTQIVLLSEIDSLDKGNGCYASNEYLANFMGLSVGRLQNIISDLRKKGFIIDISFDGRKRSISVNRDLTKKLSETSRNREYGLNENVKNEPGDLYIDNKDERKGEIPPKSPQGESGEKRKPSPQKKRNEEFYLEYFDDTFKHNHEFCIAWGRWLKFRGEIKKKLVPTTVESQAKKLQKYDPTTAADMLDQSITNGWQGIFELDPKKSGPPQKSRTRQMLEQSHGTEDRIDGCLADENLPF